MKLKFFISLKFLIPTTFILITASILVYPYQLVRALPLYFSLVIMALNSKANRLGFLLGGINSIFYAIVFWRLKLYASMASALLLSAPMQIATFIFWSKKKYKHSTTFKKLSKTQSLLLLVGSASVWIVSYMILSWMGARHIVLDNTGALIGIISTVLAMLSYKEYIFLQIISNSIALCLYASMLSENPAQITFLFYQIYAIICTAKSCVMIRELYSEQRIVSEQMNPLEK